LFSESVLMGFLQQRVPGPPSIWLHPEAKSLSRMHWACLGTSLITSSQPLMLLIAVFIYDPLTWIVSLFFLAASLARAAVGLFITLTRESSGTRCQMNSEILAVLMALNDSWKQFFSAVTCVTSALKVF